MHSKLVKSIKFEDKMKLCLIFMVALIRIKQFTTTTIGMSSDNDIVSNKNFVNESESTAADNACNSNYDKRIAVDVIFFDKHLNETAVDELDRVWFPMLYDNDVNKKVKRNIPNNLPRPDQRSLLIIFDGTASMWDDLQQLRNSAKRIVAELSTRDDNPIFNYVLVIFRDPSEWVKGSIRNYVT